MYFFNSRFTTAIRSGFVYQGTETLTIGGGDDVWVYLNGVLVLELITRDAGTSVPCKKIDISPASTTGENIYKFHQECIQN